MVDYWVIRAGKSGELWAEWSDHSPPLITLGWDIGTPENIDFSDANVVRRRIDHEYDERNLDAATSQLQSFIGGRATHMETGDFVIVLGNGSIEAIARVKELEYRDHGLSSDDSHTYWRRIEYVLKSAEAGGIPLRTLPDRFGSADIARSNLAGQAKLLSEYPGSSDDFHALLEHVSGRADVIVAQEPKELFGRSETDREFYVALSEPANFLTAYRRNVWGVRSTENLRATWESLDEGDILFFRSHARGESDKDWGLIGYGVVGDYKATKSAFWWRDEYVNDEVVYEHVFGFKETFCLGDQDVIENQSEHRKSEAQLQAECDAIVRNMLPVEEAADHLGWKSFNDINMWGPSQANGRQLLEKIHAHDRERTRAVIESDPEITLPKSGILGDLYFPDEIGASIVDDVNAALRAGKHIIFTGPPGTGKTELARNIARRLESRYNEVTGSKISTATADWSTFDTVGGHMPSSTGTGELEFRPGLVLRRFKRDGDQRNEVLVIDEINRADIDKAFGQLFTVFSGQEVQLPFERDGREVRLLPAEQYDGSLDANEYVMPQSWRLLATMNTYDKTSLYEMSYAFMRRFAFVRVPEPTLPEGDSETVTDELERLMHEYVERWDVPWDRRKAVAVARVWRRANNTIEDRAIGPAIVKDLLQHVSGHDGESFSTGLTQAVISYVLPQLEGVPKRERIVRRLAGVDEIDEDLLETAAREMLQVSLTANE